MLVKGLESGLMSFVLISRVEDSLMGDPTVVSRVESSSVEDLIVLFSREEDSPTLVFIR